MFLVGLAAVIDIGVSTHAREVPLSNVRQLGESSSATSGHLWHALNRSYSSTTASLEPPMPLPLQPPRKCERAAVVTTINEPSDAIRAFAHAPDWCVIVVGDETTPDMRYRTFARAHDHVIYLSLMDQRLLPFETVAVVPTRSFGRKNIGYLFAAWCGAKVIFDFDDDNVPLSPAALDVHADMVQHGTGAAELTASAHQLTACNPYPLFAAPWSWPRGLPLESINVNGCNVTTSSRGHRLGVIQSLANQDPDVDAIYRLGPRSALPLPFSFPTDGALLVLSGSAVAPFNAQATWWNFVAFAALMLPTTVHGRVSDIWRSYIAQCAMRCENIQLAFTAPAVEQHRNAHNYLADYMAERPLYEQTGALLRALDSVKCQNALTETVAAAYIVLYQQGFVEREDVDLADIFLRDLGRITAPATTVRATPLSVDSFGRHVRSMGPTARCAPARCEVAFMVMTKDDMSLLSRWIIYHGHLFGFENLYVFDGSIGDQKGYLERLAMSVPFNLRHDLANLNMVTSRLAAWMDEIKHSYEWIMKVDTDEFTTYAPTAGAPPDLSSSKLHLPKGNVGPTLAVEWMFQMDTVNSSDPTNCERGDKRSGGGFKQIYSGHQFRHKSLNLGSHVGGKIGKAQGLCIVHYQFSRSYEAFVRIATQTIISHKYISEMDSDATMVQKLRRNKARSSKHKVRIVLDDLEDRKIARKKYYAEHTSSNSISLHEWRNYLHEIFAMYPTIMVEHN